MENLLQSRAKGWWYSSGLLCAWFSPCPLACEICYPHPASDVLGSPDLLSCFLFAPRAAVITPMEGKLRTSSMASRRAWSSHSALC